MTSTSPLAVTAPVSSDRRPPAFGGFNLTALSLELRRVMRNRRTVMFLLVFPTMFFFLFGVAGSGKRGGPAALAYVMLSMAAYGAMVGTTSGGAAVAVERSLGWSRQLRLTPLNPLAYVAMKVMSAMTLGLVSVCVTFLVASTAGGVHLTPQQWMLSILSCWVGSLVFAAFGLFMGFLLPSENVMQFVGPMLAVMAVFGGIFIPLKQLPQTLQTIARYTPMFGVGQIARAPLSGELTAWAVGSVLLWAIVFGTGAMLLFKRDTTRV
ncbi:ABC transporter permease [Gemmatimonas groenlandica]|uniref:ABC transporter permease n=1 Tax=Gemmatimonas groenlandica TaxID=2732249 RepID=A0A6M4IY14_9BACT|nr:ABC transporter permease [Gemmatimonas groenlandica]QJR37782.1 ABC transporter permease [Gemmatimonas groenlandica]